MAIGIQGPFVAGDAKTCKSDEIFQLTTESLSSNSSVYEDFIAADSTPKSAWEKNKYFFISLVFTIIFFVCNLLCIIFVKEDRGKVKALFICI